LTYYTFNQIDFNRDNVCVDIRDGEFNWKNNSDEKENEQNNLVTLEEQASTLKNINFKIRKGQLIGCIGKKLN
jgi:ABC-type polysaccharide/polyol phosphate transport system ATPase subunit